METNKRTVMLCNLMLLGAAVIWGFCFLFQKDASESIGPATFMAVRYFLGATTIVPFIIFLELKKKPEERTKYDSQTIKYIIKMASLFAIIQMLNMVLNQAGIGYTTASKAAFLTATYMVMVPFLSYLFFKKKTPLMGWIGTFSGIIGIYFMSITGEFTINPGDMLIVGSSVFAAMHLLLITKIVQKIDGKHFICVEFYIASLYCTVIAILFEKPTLANIIECADSLFFASVLGAGICYMLMVTAQKYTDPTIGALLMSLESLFGALAGIMFLGERFSARELFGALLLSISVVIAQLKPRDKIVIKTQHKSSEVQNGTK